MNRRRFMEMLGMAAVGGTVAYSFPSVIVPKNIVSIEPIPTRSNIMESTSLGYDWFYETYKKVCMSGIGEPNFIIGNKRFADYFGLQSVSNNSLIVIRDNEIKIVDSLI